jgi:D-sedoheptulose 7-phosphate isomerase
MKKYYSNYFKSINKGLNESKYSINNCEISAQLFFEEVNTIIINLRLKKNKIYFFGNGASAAFANHMALDFSKNGKIQSKSLSDSALLTALANDYSYEEAMLEFLKIEEVKTNDLVITISSSGNSPNIINVLNYCKEKNINSLALSGLSKKNNSIELANYSIFVPMKTYGIVECIHQIFLHLILDKSMEIFEWNRDEEQNMNSKNFKI